MKRALAISAAAHVVLGALLLTVELREGDEHGTSSTVTTIAIDVIAPVRDDVKQTAEGGGSFKTEAPAPTTAPSPSTPKSTSTASTNKFGRAKTRSTAPENPFGEVAIDRPRAANGESSTGGSDRQGDGGEGFGTGGHRGDGIGFGNGGTIAVAEDDFTLPPEPKADIPPPSKARPAKLIYPSRSRDLGEEALFVARVTVDTDGYVVGARLVKGRNGPRDDEAADLIFRFRYLPALDDAGRAIKSTFEQPFHVNR